LVVAQMSIFTSRLGIAFALAMLCLGGPMARAQTAPVSYWIPGWSMGLGSDMLDGQGPSSYGNFPSFDFSDARSGGFSYARYNFPNGFFVGSQRSGMGLSGLSQSAFGNFGSLHTEGMQFGYNFKDSGLPVSVYAGFDTLKYNTGLGSPFAPFDNVSGTLPVYSVNAGVEFRPTSNLSLSFGASYTQQSGDINSLVLPGASPFAAGGRR
jgi:opacity protein-like surface antigen